MENKDIYDNLPIGVCVLRHDRKKMNILYLNRVMAGMMDRSIDDIQNHGFAQVWPHEDAAKLVQSLKGPKPSRSFVLPAFDWSSGRQRWVKLDLTRNVWDGDDCFTLWATDISASKEAEERLQAAVQEADATAELKSNF